ncbi:dual specificity protein kinase splA [Papilio machaon]|uniref:dual specificity protein kinase splA n=1 Tax=Papilio machaon TaxID=76193 RepID=UPI001E6645BE|nr:dual specificity protein kinase splA [Papilio machaon]
MMSNNIENDRSNSTGKMYPIDLAPQKITIVKSMSNTEVKMAHLITGQSKTSGSGQLITHAGSVGLMRSTAQIITPGVSSQPQMIVSGPPIFQGTPIISQGSQLLGQTSQIITQSQIINSSGIISPGTQIISQGSQLSAQVSNSSNSVSNIQSSVASSISGTQVLNVGGQLVSGSGNLVVSSSVRTIPPSVRVLPPLPHNRPVLSSVNVSTASGVLVSKAVTSHVPRGLAAGASLAVRPVTPIAASQSAGNQGGGAWSSGKGRSALVYQGRGVVPRGAAPRAPTATPPAASPTPTPVSTPTPQPSQSPHSSIITLTTSSILTSSGVISNAVRGTSPRAPTPTSTAAAPRPLPLLQRNYQPTKVVSVANVGVRGVVGNSAPSQLYYEVPLGSQQHVAHQQQQHHAPQLLHQVQQLPRPLTPYNHNQTAVQVSVVNSGQSVNEARQLATSLAASTILPRPSILRKRDIDGSPSKVGNFLSSGGAVGLSVYREVNSGVGVGSVGGGAPGWEDVPAGARGPGSGSTTMSAASSPPHDDAEPAPPPAPQPPHTPDLSPRKKPRKQMLSNEVRQCELTAEDAPPTPPPPANPPKRPQLGSGYVCGWRGTALHFVRPADVRRREPRARDILAIASQRHVLASADGWKVHHLTAQMDDLVSLEADVGSQLAGVLRALETASGRALAALQPHEHALLELLKGNIQRSKIVCEGIQEAREDILRVFKHRNFVSDILTRQADKRCYRKHRSQS